MSALSLLWRLYVAVAVLMWLTAALLSTRYDLSMALWAALAVAFLPAGLGVWSIAVFRFKYSSLGSAARRQMPKAGELASMGVRGTLTPLADTMTPLKLVLFRAGLGIQILRVWEVFIPWEEIQEVRTADRWKLTLQVTLYHDSHELRWRRIAWCTDRSTSTEQFMMEMTVLHSIGKQH